MKKNYETCLASIDLLLFSGLVDLPPPAGLSSPPGSPKVKSFTNLTGWTKIEVSLKKLNLKSFILPPLPAQWDARSGWNHFSLVPGMRWNSAKQVYINCGNLLLSMQKKSFSDLCPYLGGASKGYGTGVDVACLARGWKLGRSQFYQVVVVGHCKKLIKSPNWTFTFFTADNSWFVKKNLTDVPISVMNPISIPHCDISRLHCRHRALESLIEVILVPKQSRNLYFHIPYKPGRSQRSDGTHSLANAYCWPRPLPLPFDKG